MNGINEKIESHARKEKRNAIIAVIGISIIAIPFFSFLFIPNMGATTQITGTVERLIGLPTDEGQNLYLLVKLKNGETVRSYIPNTSFYRKGKEVNLEKREALIFGKPIFKYRGYLDENA